MRFRRLHRWGLSVPAARALQARLAGRVVETSPAGLFCAAGLDLVPSTEGPVCVTGKMPVPPGVVPPRLVAGADMSHGRTSPWLYGAVVLVRLPAVSIVEPPAVSIAEPPAFEVVETVTARRRATFPYVPGFLSFREGPVLLDAFRRLRRRPDAILFDAHGRAHPRRFGLACHLGLWLGRPSAGCAKSRLCGAYAEPGPERGARVALRDGGACLGVVLRTRAGAKPVFVSVGHRLSLTDAEALVLRCGDGRHRLPEPLRLAHLAVNQFRREAEG